MNNKVGHLEQSTVRECGLCLEIPYCTAFALLVILIKCLRDEMQGGERCRLCEATTDLLPVSQRGVPLIALGQQFTEGNTEKQNPG